MTDAEDTALTRAIARPARNPADNEGLRTLGVGRLSDELKAVLRWSLSTKQLSVYCEPCGWWTALADDEDASDEWTCPKCERLYIAEVVIYTTDQD